MPAESLKLEYLNLSHSKLKSLRLGNTPNLERLILEGRNDLVELQMPVENLKLKYLDLSHSQLKTLHLMNNLNLETLILKGCNDLVELQMPVENLKLEYLELSHSKLKTIHLGNSLNLETLILEGCNDLVELQMLVESQMLKELNLSHSKLRILDLGLTPNLKRLNLVNCYNLVDINAPIGCLINLLFLDLSCCGRFKYFVFDKYKWSQPAEAGSLSELHLIAEPTDVCLLHPYNDSPKFQFLCYYIEDPASSFENLEMLISIGVCACTNLERFSRSICRLKCLRKFTLEGSIPEVPKDDLDRLVFLEELKFSSTNIKILPDSICMLNQLKLLEIVSCWLLEKLPEDLEHLQCLEKLILMDCKVLLDLPNNICMMKSLISLHLDECRRIMKLPEGIGCLDCLQELDMTRSGVSCLPTGIFQSKGLRIVGEDQQLRSLCLHLRYKYPRIKQL